MTYSSLDSSFDAQSAADLPERLKRLLASFESYEKSMESRLLAPLRRKQRPTAAAVSEFLELLDGYDACVADVEASGVRWAEGESVAEMLAIVESQIAARTWRGFREASVLLLRRVLRIGHPAGTSPALELLHASARELLDALEKAEGVVGDWEPRLGPYRDLWSLLTEGERLSEDQSDAMTENVALRLGRPLVRPSFFRLLIIRDEVESAESEAKAIRTPQPAFGVVAPSEPSAAPAPSTTEAAAPECEPIAEAAGESDGQSDGQSGGASAAEPEVRSAAEPVAESSREAADRSAVNCEDASDSEPSETLDDAWPVFDAEGGAPESTSDADSSPETDTGVDASSASAETGDVDADFFDASEPRDAGAKEGPVPDEPAWICSANDLAAVGEAVAPLPDELRTFERFRETHWVDPLTDQCEAAPWCRPDFLHRLGQAADAAMRAAAAGDVGRLADGYLIAKALDGAVDAPLHATTILHYSELWCDPLRATTGRDPARIERLQLGEVSESELQLALTLEAVRPTHVKLPYGESLTELIERACFQDGPLKAVVSGLLRHHALSNSEPIALVRAALTKEPPRQVDWESELRRSRKALHDEVKRVTLNAGQSYVGVFAHCSRAWSTFMTDYVHPLAAQLYPQQPYWDIQVVAEQIDQLKPVYTKLADRANARARARRMMDRVVDSLVESLESVNTAYAELVKSRNPELVPELALTGEVERLKQTEASGGAAESLARRLLLRLFSTGTPKDEGTPIELSPRFFAAYPDLIDLLDSPPDPRRPLLADQLEGDPRRIAARLLYPRPSTTPQIGWKLLEEQAKEAKAFERAVLLGGRLSPLEQAAAAQEMNRLLVDKQHRIERLRRAWRGLEALQVPSHKVNRAVVDWAEHDRSSGGDLKLIARWLDKAADATEAQLRQAVAAWESALTGAPDERLRREALKQGRYDVVVRGGDSTLPQARPLRETAWRNQAKVKFPSPRQVLLDLRPTSVVAEKWTADLQEKLRRHNTLSSLLSEFVKWVFGTTLRSVGDKATRRFGIETEAVRRHLAAGQPTYLPQLHAARSLYVATVAASPSDQDYRRQVVDVARECGDNAIVAILCPGMSTAIRDQVRRELQNTNLFAGTIDDLDLCRLLNPDDVQPNLVVGLLEIVLEQQPWRARNPFSVPEGSEMRLEMYVGRREEAEQLATTSAKTRLFSGRKLGKTALLQFIRQTWDDRVLPNGKRLRVIYVSIVGVGSEELFAKKLLDQLRRDFPDVALPSVAAAPADVVQGIQTVLTHHPEFELLIVLDEADEFVAQQVREDARKKGSGLCWQLRGVPRVRYVFTGYWATATRDGVFYNWGDVLELSQLDHDAAVGLIARPLARLGIDAGQQAAEIAFRCGYQPAVLLRFGERLVERMAEDGYREGARVTHELVQDTFEDAKVQAEIQGVVRANFQGNPFGHAVFGVVLQETSRAPLGRWLRRLDLTAKETFEALLKDQTVARERGSENLDLETLAAAQLRDMHLRKLLQRRIVDGQPEYQLRFPHHLATLLAEIDLPTEIRANLRAWRETHAPTGEATFSECRSPIHLRDFANVRDMLKPEWADVVPPVIVVGSLWYESLVKEPGGIPDRLGLTAGRSGSAADYHPESAARCWHGADETTLERALADPPRQKPAILLGGVELLRTAVVKRYRDSSPLEVLGPSRMTDGQVRWWFQRILGVEFASERVYDEVHAKTGGVPVLVGEFQELLLPGGPPEGGVNLSAERVDRAMLEYSSRLADERYAAKIAARLTNRELALLRMIRCISHEFGAADGGIGEWLSNDWTDGHFGEKWRQHFGRHSFPPPYHSQTGDVACLETLLLTGMAPSSTASGGPDERLRGMSPQDPIVAILSTLR